MTQKRFPTIGGSTKVSAETPRSTARTFGTVKSATPTAAPIKKVDLTKAPFDTTDAVVIGTNDIGITTVPQLRRPNRTPVVAEKPKAKPKKIKPVVPLTELKARSESKVSDVPVPKPALAKRNPKAKPEVTAPVVATKKAETVKAKSAIKEPVKAEVKQKALKKVKAIKPAKTVPVPKAKTEAKAKAKISVKAKATKK